MKKYAKIINEKTNEVQVGAGCSDEYYKEIGMKLMEVEQAYNGLWYIKGYVPLEPDEYKKARVLSIRNLYLQQSDFTQLPDSPFTFIEKKQYADYREYLRNYTKNENWWESEPYTFEEWQKNY